MFKRIGFEITKKCNLNCVHCYLGGKNNSLLEKEYIFDVLEKIGSDFNFVYLTGGEPMLHPDFLEIYTKIRKKGFCTNIFTNASLLTDEIFDVFKEMMPHKLNISLYGMSERVNAEVTGTSGHFEQIIQNILRLRKITENISLKFTVLTPNFHEIGMVLDFCNKNKIHNSISSYVIPKLRNNEIKMYYRLTPEKSHSIMNAYGLSAFSDRDKCDFCDAGQNIFIDSEKIIRGCPVLESQYDLDISRNIDVELIAKTRQKMIEAYKSSDICPAWVNLEDQKTIYSFIGK